MALVADARTNDSLNTPVAGLQNDWDRMQSVVSDIPDGGEQNNSHYDRGLRRWGELEQRIGEIRNKSRLIAGKFGRGAPERAKIIMDAWQITLKKLLEQRLAAEKKLSGALPKLDDGVARLQSLDEILMKLDEFQTAEDQRAYLVADHDDARQLTEELANFLKAVDERYKMLLSEERNELMRNGALESLYNARELQQLLVEIRGYSQNFRQSFVTNPTLAKVMSDDPDLFHGRVCLLNPLPRPRAAEVVEELQLRYTASKLKTILFGSDESEQVAKLFLQKAVDTFSPRYEHVGDIPWNIVRRDLGSRCQSDASKGITSDSSETISRLSSVSSLSSLCHLGQSDMDISCEIIIPASRNV